jgi:hypothetical protein
MARGVWAAALLCFGCTDGGQTGDPGDMPAPSCTVDADCEGHAPLALEEQLGLVAPDSGAAAATASVRAARCGERGCAYVVVIEDACYVAGSPTAYDCALTDDEILGARER